MSTLTVSMSLSNKYGYPLLPLLSERGHHQNDTSSDGDDDVDDDGDDYGDSNYIYNRQRDAIVGNTPKSPALIPNTSDTATAAGAGAGASNDDGNDEGRAGNSGSNISTFEPTSQIRHSVRFSTAEYRYYPITIGDNPSVTRGVPVTIGWHFWKEATQVVPVETLASENDEEDDHDFDFHYENNCDCDCDDWDDDDYDDDDDDRDNFDDDDDGSSYSGNSSTVSDVGQNRSTSNSASASKSKSKSKSDDTKNRNRNRTLARTRKTTSNFDCGVKERRTKSSKSHGRLLAGARSRKQKHMQTQPVRMLDPSERASILMQAGHSRQELTKALRRTVCRKKELRRTAIEQKLLPKPLVVAGERVQELWESCCPRSAAGSGDGCAMLRCWGATSRADRGEDDSDSTGDGDG